MTRLKQYIREYKSVGFEDNIEGMLQVIESECKKYLKLLKGKTPLYRGGRYPGIMGISGVRQDRKAIGVFSKGQVEFVNKWLEKSKYPRRDKSLITTPDPAHAQQFASGNIYYVFPIGKNWDFAYTKAKDFNFSGELSMRLGQIATHKKEAKEFLSGFISDDNFNKAYNKKWEIWFNCKKFYYTNANEYTL